MGMTIDDAIKYYSNKNVVLTEEDAEANTIALNTMCKYQKLQADYENRLKADMVAILEDIRIEAVDSFCSSFSDYDNLIQQKINALKGDT